MTSKIHTLHHPDAHIAASPWSEGQILDVASCYSNPFRWRARRELANDFRRHMAQSPNVRLHMIELAYGDRPFEVTSAENPNDIQLRTNSELFHKENLLNLAVQHFPPGWEHGAAIDADFHFTRHDWALEAVHQLQHHEWVQLFSSYTDISGETLGTGHRPISTNNGFAFNYIENGCKLPHGFSDGGWATAGMYDHHTKDPRGRKVGATGGAWAFRRRAFDGTGGLLDRCILGHGDWFMAFGLVGETAPDMRIGGYTREYREYIRAWQRRAVESCKRNIGYVDCHATHGFHGPKGRRGYSSRDAILVEHEYSPLTDVYPDWQGVLQLTSSKWNLRDAVRRYFLSRSEDMPHIGGA